MASPVLMPAFSMRSLLSRTMRWRQVCPNACGSSICRYIQAEASDGDPHPRWGWRITLSHRMRGLRKYTFSPYAKTFRRASGLSEGHWSGFLRQVVFGAYGSPLARLAWVSAAHNSVNRARSERPMLEGFTSVSSQSWFWYSSIG